MTVPLQMQSVGLTYTFVLTVDNITSLKDILLYSIIPVWRMVQHGHCHIWTKMEMSGLGVDEKSENNRE